MLFSSIIFIFFFLTFFFIFYYIVPIKAKNYVLLIFSLIFYSFGEPIYILLMLFSTFIDFLNGKIYKKYGKKYIFLILAIIINLSLLFFFKYCDFIINIVNSIFNLNIDTLNLELPIGISFYTFQTMSYSIDVYKGNIKVEDNYFKYSTYVSMFPQLIAGPIVRYEDINKEINKRTITIDNINDGLERFLIGLFKKVLLANNIGLLYTTIYNDNINNLSILSLVLAILAYSFQIYYDFSGYSDMAIGLGKMLGFTFKENFNYPYIATSITDFWRRWHITLSTWFKDYVYIPLGGSKKSNLITIRNLLIVWILTGLWHGASINFIIWGLYYGIILIIEKFMLKKYLDKAPNFIKHIYSISLILIGWMIFAFDTNTILYIKSIFGYNNIPLINNNFLFNLSNYIILLIICIYFSIPHHFSINNTLKAVIYLILFIFTISSLVSNSYNPFLYFRF